MQLILNHSPKPGKLPPAYPNRNGLSLQANLKWHHTSNVPHLKRKEDSTELYSNTVNASIDTINIFMEHNIYNRAGMVSISQFDTLKILACRYDINYNV